MPTRTYFRHLNKKNVQSVPLYFSRTNWTFLALGHNKKDPIIVNQLASIISSRKNGMWSFPINSNIYQMWVIHEILMCIDIYINSPD